MIYKWIGKLVVKIAALFVKRRYGRQLQVGTGLAVVAIGIGLYMASRNVEEG